MFEVVQCGRHAKVRLNGRFAPVPRYAAHLPGGTLRSILKLLGVTAADLEERATRYAYPVEVLEKADGITVTCPDVPEMVTGGWGDVAANLKAAEDALATALSGYVDDGRAIPRPSPVEGRPVVAIDTLAAAKLALHEAILEQGISNVELAGRLGLDEKAVRRLRDPLHRSHIGAVETALRVLGRRFVLEIA
jgi:antitoxin HicB